MLVWDGEGAIGRWRAGKPELTEVERRAALLAVASHCTVHNSLTQPPLVQITLDAPAASSAIG